jgi:hypothetical protein
VALLTVIGVACSNRGVETLSSASSAPADLAWTDRDPPAGEHAFAPRLAAGGGGVMLTWLERLEAAEGAPRHRLLFARLAEGAWSPPAVIAEGEDLFANWADFPGVVQAPDGTLLAHWLAKTSEATYAYSIAGQDLGGDLRLFDLPGPFRRRRGQLGIPGPFER